MYTSHEVPVEKETQSSLHPNKTRERRSRGQVEIEAQEHEGVLTNKLIHRDSGQGEQVHSMPSLLESINF